MKKRRNKGLAFKALMSVMIVLLAVFCLNIARLISDIAGQLILHSVPLSIFVISLCLIVAIEIIVSALLVIDTVKDIRKILKK